MPPSSMTSVTRHTQTRAAQCLLDFCLENSFIHREDWQKLPETLRKELGEEKDTSVLLRRLVQANVLTAYQVDRIEAGTIHGMILGSYRVLDRLGVGGMGVVFLAEHIHLRRLAAIKMLPLYSGSDSTGAMLTRFFNEIRVIAQLQHPNIVAAIDTGEIPGDGADAPVLYYHVMEYVPGKDLEQRVQSDGPLALTSACDLTYQIASALVEAEKHGLVHRDIKPSNILVTPEGQAKLLDFGLVRSHQNRHTQPGMVLGTIDYLAPEQARDASAVDIRADIFGLGGTLYWALTGRVPFPSEAPLQQQVVARLSQNPPSVSRFRPDMPPEMDSLIARMMATNPEDRYQNPKALMRALLPFLRSQSGAFLYLPARQTGQESATRGNNAEIQTGEKRRILLVDDEDMMRAVARHALAAEGFECEEADNGAMAVEMARAKRYDLVLLDVELPQMRGTDVLRSLRDEPPGPNLKVIMASGRVSAEDMSNMLLAGADDFLAKPFSLVQLTARVKAALRLKAAQDRSDSLAQSLRALNQQLEQNLLARDSDLIDARNALTLAIAELVTFRGIETPGHLVRIQKYVRILGQEASKVSSFAGKLDQNFIQLLESTAPLHDVGMIGLPDHIFLKPGRLTDDERILMRAHTTIGSDILQKITRTHGFTAAFLQMAIDITRHHHERWDGKGYPDRLSDHDIPLAARLVSIADVYDALRSRRPHKPALSHAAVIEILAESPPGQFDPALLHVFQDCADQFDQVYRANPD
ncbi:MAG: protein kinase [Planctomycetes bacterium]|nr:protein kinase [Planctomycetota bacterium]